MMNFTSAVEPKAITDAGAKPKRAPLTKRKFKHVKWGKLLKVFTQPNCFQPTIIPYNVAEFVRLDRMLDDMDTAFDQALKASQEIK